MIATENKVQEEYYCTVRTIVVDIVVGLSRSSVWCGVCADTLDMTRNYYFSGPARHIYPIGTITPKERRSPNCYCPESCLAMRGERGGGGGTSSSYSSGDGETYSTFLSVIALTRDSQRTRGRPNCELCARVIRFSTLDKPLPKLH